MLHSTLFAIVFALTARAASPPHYLDIIKRREPAIAGGQVVTLSPSGGVRIVPDKDTMGDGKYLKEDGVFYVISNPDGFNHKFTVKFYNEGQRKQMEIKVSASSPTMQDTAPGTALVQIQYAGGVRTKEIHGPP